MPRRTPVKELQKEEVVPNSPVRRSSRLSSSSPVPTRILTRRNSSSEEPAQAPKPTRSRRLSLTQEPEVSEESDKKKPTSTIRTRRSSQNKDEEVEPVRATRSRSSSVPKEEIPAKRVTRRQRSTSEEPETSEEPAKKITRSRSGAAAKNNENNDTKTSKKTSAAPGAVSASTPVKKSGSISEPLESIEESNKEVDSPVEVPSMKSKRKTMEASKLDFDLSIINEASITEEGEESPKKKTTVEETATEQRTEPEVQDVEHTKDPADAVPSDVIVPKEPEPEQKPAKDSNINEAADTTSDASFNLQLSSSVLENTEETPADEHDLSNKENRCPAQDSEVEPMDVDDSTFSIFSPVQNKSLKLSVALKTGEMELKLQQAEKMNDDMAERLAREIQLNGQANKTKRPDEVADVEKDSSSGPKDEEAKEVEKEQPVESDCTDQAAVSEVQNGPSSGPKDEEAKEVEKEQPLKSDCTDQAAVQNGSSGGPDMLPDSMKDERDAVEEAKESEKVEEKDTVAVAEETQEVEKSRQDEEEPVERVDVEESLKSPERLNDETQEVDTSLVTVEGDLKEQPQSAANQQVKEISVEKKENTDVADAVEKESSEDMSTPSLSELESSETFAMPAADKDLENELNKPNEEVAPKNVAIEDADKTDTDTLSSRASSIFELNVASRIKEDQHEESIISVDDIDDKEVSAVAVMVQEEEAEEIDVVDDDLNSKLESFKDVVAEDDDDLNSKLVSEVKPNLSSNEKIIIHNVIVRNDDLLIKNTNQTKSAIPSKVERSEAINLCDSDSDVVVNGHDSSYRSPVKRPKSGLYSRLGDDDLFGSAEQPKRADLFDGSMDSKYCISLTPKQKGKADRKATDSESSDDVVELSDEDENLAKGAADSTFHAYEKDRSITIDIVEQETLPELDIKAEAKEIAETPIFANSSRRQSLDKTSITMQETVKAGDDEKSLPDRIHRVVDIFCAGLKNKSDLSVNVSLEYTGQSPDDEDEGNKLEISLTASDVKEQSASPPKGSKRRRICRHSETGLKLDESDEKVASVEEKQSPAKKKKRRSTICNEAPGTPDFRSTSVAKSSPKVSFLVASENDKSAKKKNRKSGGVVFDTSLESQRKASPKKEVPRTPYKVPQIEQTEDVDTEESADESMVSPSQDSIIYEDLLSKSFQDEEDDQTWVPGEEEEASISDADATNGSDVEEEDLLEETLIDANRKEDSSENSNDEVFVPKGEEQEEFAKPRTRKFFRSSAYNLSELLGFSESDEAVSKKEKTKAAKAQIETSAHVERRKKIRKKVKDAFESKNVTNIVPETSEVKERKRRHQTSTSVDEDEDRAEKVGLKKKRKVARPGKKESVVTIRPTVGRSKHRAAFRMKPSTKTCSGWDVSSF